MKLLLIILFFPLSILAKPNGITTNAVTMESAPKWLKRTRVEKITDKIQTKLEWSTRRIPVYWHNTDKDFQKVHKFGAIANAITKINNGNASIHLGPKVNTQNFDQIFSHELVHVILFQKYKGSIPKWLEEGLANHLANKKKVDYKWLAQQSFPKDVRLLAHPFDENSQFSGKNDDVIYRYVASQAFAEMLDKKCDLQNLIRLSVQRKMEDYMKTYCEIKDLNAAFKAWVISKSR